MSIPFPFPIIFHGFQELFNWCSICTSKFIKEYCLNLQKKCEVKLRKNIMLITQNYIYFGTLVNRVYD